MRRKIKGWWAFGLCLVLFATTVFAHDRNQQVTDFVQRLYQIVLGRAGDENGLNGWTSVLLDQGGNGADVAYGFFFSREYQEQKKSNDAFVTDLYQAILNRKPDAGGKAFWIGRLEDGMSRHGIFAGVVNSEEFGQLCGRYGIQRGTYFSPEPRDQNADVTAFVQRLYRNVLGRAGDEGGLNDWTSLLNRGGTGTEVAASFILSEEYRNKTIALTDYVEMLYRALLNRGSDAAGKASWVTLVKRGAKEPAELIPAFTGSVEFGRLCDRYGIKAGSEARVSGDFPHMAIYGKEEKRLLDTYQPGDAVPEDLGGEDIGFWFASFKIDDSVWNRIRGISYPEGCSVPLDDLRYLRVLHRDFQGNTRVGELIVNRKVDGQVLEIFEELYRNRYPIEKIRLIDEYGGDDEASMADNNTSCFNYRAIAGSSKLSAHSKGLAIDLNPLYNPYVKGQGRSRICRPAVAEAFADRSRSFSYKITREDDACRLFTSHGFTWGGGWKSVKDYQHFEWSD
ncbi:DUF4214 domain-containing protein [Hominifimenecus sp. rT4P-3]|uniref:DUF4214 domain-containing protein n=1 Tax=Hominifimenecus sp. rT4P-3 TaxID=3242979 RepID=UPI003DA62415